MSAHPLEALSALLDGELPPDERRAVETHLAACPSCARHLRELGAVDALARDLPAAAAPDGYMETLPGRVRRRIRADRPRAARAPWVWPLAAGLALAVLAPIVLQQRDAVRQAPAPEAKVPAAPAAREKTLESGKADADAADSAEAEAPPATRPAARAGALRRQPAPPAQAPGEAREAQDAFAPPPAAYTQEPAAPPAHANAAAGAPLPPAAVAETAAAERDEERARVAGGLAGRTDAPTELKKAEGARVAAAQPKRATDPESDFRDAASVPASGLEDARRARDAWRRFVALHPSGPRADEGRVRLIESAVMVYRLTRDASDRAMAEREGRAYLAAAAPPQAERVREALRGLDAGR